MNLVFDKAKLDDHLKQVGSVDTTRNIAFVSGAQFQNNLDNVEHAKVLSENATLKAENQTLKDRVAALEAAPAKPKKK